MTCPKCDGPVQFRTNEDVWNAHGRCQDCGVILFANCHSDTPNNPLNFCGSPELHWKEGGIHLDLLAPSSRPSLTGKGERKTKYKGDKR